MAGKIQKPSLSTNNLNANAKDTNKFNPKESVKPQGQANPQFGKSVDSYHKKSNMVPFQELQQRLDDWQQWRADPKQQWP